MRGVIGDTVCVLRFRDAMVRTNLSFTARDYVEGMWRMLQQPQPEDFVLATGETHPVREFVEKSFGELGIQIRWQGTGEKEEGVDIKTDKVIIKVDRRYFRPAEVECVIIFLHRLKDVN